METTRIAVGNAVIRIAGHDGQYLTEEEATRLRSIITKVGGHFVNGVDGTDGIKFADEKTIDAFITAVANAGYSFVLREDLAQKLTAGK